LAAVAGTEIERRTAFRQAHAALENRIKLFVSLPLANLDRMSLQAKLDAIGREPPSAAAA
jgi:arsenate reductase (thioredoxin)